MLFGTYGNFRGPPTKYEIAVSTEMQDTWQAFANDPENGLARRNWERFTTKRDIVRSFGENGTVAVDRIGELKAQEEQCLQSEFTKRAPWT